jgi:hypothetical protein
LQAELAGVFPRRKRITNGLDHDDENEDDSAPMARHESRVNSSEIPSECLARTGGAR